MRHDDTRRDPLPQAGSNAAVHVAYSKPELHELCMVQYPGLA